MLAPDIYEQNSILLRLRAFRCWCKRCSIRDESLTRLNLFRLLEAALILALIEQCWTQRFHCCTNVFRESCLSQYLGNIGQLFQYYFLLKIGFSLCCIAANVGIPAWKCLILPLIVVSFIILRSTPIVKIEDATLIQRCDRKRRFIAAKTSALKQLRDIQMFCWREFF